MNKSNQKSMEVLIISLEFWRNKFELSIYQDNQHVTCTYSTAIIEVSFFDLDRIFRNCECEIDTLMIFKTNRFSQWYSRYATMNFLWLHQKETV